MRELGNHELDFVSGGFIINPQAINILIQANPAGMIRSYIATDPDLRPSSDGQAITFTAFQNYEADDVEVTVTNISVQNAVTQSSMVSDPDDAYLVEFSGNAYVMSVDFDEAEGSDGIILESRIDRAVIENSELFGANFISELTEPSKFTFLLTSEANQRSVQAGVDSLDAPDGPESLEVSLVIGDEEKTYTLTQIGADQYALSQDAAKLATFTLQSTQDWIDSGLTVDIGPTNVDDSTLLFGANFIGELTGPSELTLLLTSEANQRSVQAGVDSLDAPDGPESLEVSLVIGDEEKTYTLTQIGADQYALSQDAARLATFTMQSTQDWIDSGLTVDIGPTNVDDSSEPVEEIPSGLFGANFMSGLTELSDFMVWLLSEDNQKTIQKSVDELAPIPLNITAATEWKDEFNGLEVTLRLQKTSEDQYALFRNDTVMATFAIKSTQGWISSGFTANVGPSNVVDYSEPVVEVPEAHEIPYSYYDSGYISEMAEAERPPIQGDMLTSERFDLVMQALNFHLQLQGYVDDARSSDPDDVEFRVWIVGSDSIRLIFNQVGDNTYSLEFPGSEIATFNMVTIEDWINSGFKADFGPTNVSFSVG